MSRRTVIIFCSLLVILFTSFAFSPASVLEDEILAQTNQFRKSKGKSTLEMKQELNRIAEQHSEDMARGRVRFGHTGFNSRFSIAKSRLSGISTFAENVAYGATSAREVVTDWKKSPGHRKNLLGQFRYIGIGTAKDSKGRRYYTQVFAN